MSHACHRFWKCYKTLTFCSLLTRCTIPCACHAKRHLNLQKWREHVVFCTFWLGNVLRATTACTFSTSQLPKVVRTWHVLYILSWKRASRHNGVQFFISHLASWLRTRRFSEPTFRPSGATNHWKNTCIFFLLTLSLLWSCFFFSSLLFSFLTLPTSAFSSVHVVGRLTSKTSLGQVGLTQKERPVKIMLDNTVFRVQKWHTVMFLHWIVMLIQSSPEYRLYFEAICTVSSLDFSTALKHWYLQGVQAYWNRMYLVHLQAQEGSLNNFTPYKR